MSLYKRSSSPNWYYRLTPPGGGPVVQGSTGTSNKAQAQEFYDRLKVELWNQAKLGHKPRYTWNDAVVRYVGDREGLAKRLEEVWLPNLDGTAPDPVILPRNSEGLYLLQRVRDEAHRFAITEFHFMLFRFGFLMPVSNDCACTIP